MSGRITSGFNAEGIRLAASAAHTRSIGDMLPGSFNPGTAANEVFWSAGGRVTMAGGAGDDTYQLWDSRDVIVETANGGTDTVVLNNPDMFFRLSPFVENIIVNGANSKAMGSETANIMAGGDGSQKLDGAGGADILSGGAGADTFVFRVGAGHDIITDFQVGVDKIVLGGGHSLVTDFASLQARMTISGSDTVIDFGGGSAATLKGVAPSQLKAADFALPIQTSGLVPTFVDDFTTFSGNATGFTATGSATWTTQKQFGQRTLEGNREVQYYTDETTGGPYPFTLRYSAEAGSSVLDITARPTTGLPVGRLPDGTPWAATYASGNITSINNLVQTYGYFEMRANMPAVQGFWPCFWLLRADGKWPGEIDIFEVHGQEPDKVYTTVHVDGGDGTRLIRGNNDQGIDLSAGFHTFGLSWRPDQIKWYVNGVEVFSLPTTHDLHSPMFILANLPVGGVGSWPGPADGVTPGTMSIDYIKAWQFADLAGPWKPTEIRTGLIDGQWIGDTLTGTANADRITGNGGADTIITGAGADVLVFRPGSGRDVVTDFTVGTDTLLLVGVDPATVTVAVVGASTVITFGTDSITLSNVTNLPAGAIQYGDTPIDAGWGADLIDRSGRTNAQIITGNGGNDTIRGGAGDDWINGGEDRDVMTGGAGRDTFVFKSFDAGATILDFVSGVDRILFVNAGGDFPDIQPGSVWVNPSRNAAGQSGIEINYGPNNGDHIFLLGVTQLAQGDIVFGSTGNARANNIFGNSAANTLLGGAGNDILDGHAGADRMEGGLGDDSYFVENAGDVVIEAENAGTDLVSASVSFSLAGQFAENLTLTGTGAINGTGNALANTIIGNSAANVLMGGEGTDWLYGRAGDDILSHGGGGANEIMDGGEGNDTGDWSFSAANWSINLATGTASTGGTTRALLTSIENVIGSQGNDTITGDALANRLAGGAGNDTLLGGGGNDSLDGGAGADRMEGGLGDDSYVVDNIGDVVIEADNAGTDLVSSSITFSLVGRFAENLTLTGTAAINGTGNALANTIIGNGAANLLDGGAGADRMEGGLGDDRLEGGDGVDSLFGGAGDDVLSHGHGGANEVLDGGQGNDTGDWSYSAANWTINLATGTANIGGMTRAQLTSIENVIGGQGNDAITGNALANRLDGGAGADTMVGGLGNDTYIVDHVGDMVIEASGGGTDAVFSSVSFSLYGQFAENLTLTGTAAINGTGNALANILIGNGAANVLNGGSGADTLTGGGGADSFLFSTTLGAGNIDRITDFSVADDTIQLSRAIFGGVAGPLGANAFVIGAAAADAADRIIYNSVTGAVLFDADGTGSGSAVQFATLNTGLQLTHNDFLFV